MLKHVLMLILQSDMAHVTHISRVNKRLIPSFAPVVKYTGEAHRCTEINIKSLIFGAPMRLTGEFNNGRFLASRTVAHRCFV